MRRGITPDVQRLDARAKRYRGVALAVNVAGLALKTTISKSIGKIEDTTLRSSW
jgi:hypothetical protein